MYESSSAEESGHIVVARLRRAATRYPHDAQLAALLTELRSGSEEFRKIWETRPVHAPGHRTKTLDHPSAGKLRLDCDVLLVPEDDQEVVLMTVGSRIAFRMHPAQARRRGSPKQWVARLIDGFINWQSSANNRRCSSSDSKPSCRLVNTVYCSPGRCSCRARQVNRRTGSHDSKDSALTSRTGHKRAQ